METIKKERRYRMLTLTRVRSNMEETLKQKTVTIELISRMESLLDTYFQPELKALVDSTQQGPMLLSDSDDAKEDRETEKSMLDEVDKFRAIAVNYQAKIKSYQAQLTAATVRQSILPSPGGTPGSPSASMVGAPLQHQFTKMKEIEPPTFNGDLTKFFEWKNLFSNLIHNRPPTEMGNTLKLYYLKKAMVGDIEGLLSDFELSDEGYVLAWDFVIFRFEKRRSIVKAFFRKLQHLEPIKNERSLQKLLDSTNGIIRGLTAAGEEVNDTFSRYLAFYISTKLDSATLKDWEDSLTSTDSYPKFDQFSKFLQCRAFAAEERQREAEYQSESSYKEVRGKKSSASDREKKSFVTTVSCKQKCVVYGLNHFLNQCPDFKAKSLQDRYDIVKKFKLCLICFDARHGASECKSKFVCNCGGRHSQFLHFDFGKKSEKSSLLIRLKVSKRNRIRVSRKNRMSLSHYLRSYFVIIVMVLAEKFELWWIIALNLKSSAIGLFASIAFLQNRLNLLRLAEWVKSSVNLVAISRFGDFKLSINADVVPASSIAYTVHLSLSSCINEELRKYRLADPAWYSQNVNIDQVDMIIGGKFYEKIICDESVWVGDLKLRKTKFGYTVGGVAPTPFVYQPSFSECTIQEIDLTLRRFWELEEANYIPTSKEQESQACVKYFEETVRFTSDGKFQVKLPFQVEKCQIASNRDRALANFYHVERTLDPKIWDACVNFLVEYREAGHMELAEPAKGEAYYIPYRPVIKESSPTTPVRVVFNALSYPKGEISLNDGLMKGPVVQRKLFDILISMRSFRYVVCADIKQMYRMIWVDPADQDMQRIFFRKNASESLQEYRLLTLTYGTKPASFIATKSLEVVAAELLPYNVQAAEAIKNFFYMDDLIVGSDSFGELWSLQKSIHAALSKRGFQLRKYSSNCRELLEKISPELLSVNALKSFEEEGINQVVLGVTWNPSSDSFGVQLDIDSVFKIKVITKRVILSYTSRIFDPMGLVSPITVRGKLLLQSLWLKENRGMTRVAKNLR